MCQVLMAWLLMRNVSIAMKPAQTMLEPMTLEALKLVRVVRSTLEPIVRRREKLVVEPGGVAIALQLKVTLLRGPTVPRTAGIRTRPVRTPNETAGCAYLRRPWRRPIAELPLIGLVQR